MNYHIEIEQLRNELRTNRQNYSIEQLAEGYDQLASLIDRYLTSEGK
jgi:hypothetical protein